MRLVKRYPIVTVIVICVALFGLIWAGNYIRIRNSGLEETEPRVKKVTLYSIGESAKVQSIGNVRKSNVYTITAQTSGVLQTSFYKEGDSVSSGTSLFYISTNYQGGSIFSIQRQIAQKNYDNIVETFDDRMDIIEKQEELADLADDNDDELRRISQQNLEYTKEQLEFNEDFLQDIEDSLEELESLPSSDETDSLITSTRSLKSQLLSSNSQLKNAVNSLEYRTDDDEAPSRISNIQENLNKTQLEISRKSLKLSKEISYLQYKLALINESMAYPATFSSGVIQKIHVLKGDSVSPGMPLATISGPQDFIQVNVLVSKQIADNYSRLESSKIYSGNRVIDAEPFFISSEATDGTLHTIKFIIDSEHSELFTNESNVIVELPVGYPDTSSAMPLIPVDIVTQTSTDAYVFIFDNGKAQIRNVSLGTIFGQYVIVEAGLSSGDQIIRDKNVLDGDFLETRDE